MRRPAVAPALLAALTLAACGEASDAGGDAEVQPVGPERAGSVAALAQCTDWNEGTKEEQLATIADIRAQLNQAGSDGPTPDLPDDEAYEVLDRACAQEYAAGFRLYKIYARAAAFAPLSAE
jgi:hypothetical protein